MVEMRYMICHWATSRSDPQNLLSTTLDVLLQERSIQDKSRIIQTNCHVLWNMQ